MTALENCESRSAEEQIYGYDNQGPKQRCYMSGDFALPRCVPGYHSIGVGVCSRNCPPGFQDVGEGCLDNQRYGRTPKAAPEPPAPDLTGWTVCASEGGRCQFEGTAEVRYGVGNKWNIQTVTNGVDCNNTVFGDPASGLAKQCLLSPNITPNAPPDVNTRDANGNNDLHLAVGRNDIPAINDLLNRGIDVNALNSANETPVTLAVEFDNTPALLAMLAKGGDMNAALHRIASRNREGMLRAVAGNFPIRMTNEMFDLAISSGAIGVALMSLKYGVDPNRAMGHGIYSRNMQMIDAALAAGANPDTALIFAIENRMPDLISRSLVQYKATPQVAMDLAIPINDAQTLALALDRGANPTIGLPVAVKASNAAMVENLLARGADANSGLMPAVESGNDQIIDMLLARGANPNPAMWFAVERQKISLVRRLLAAKAIPTDQLILGLAGRIGNMEVINVLIEAGGYPTSIIGGAIEERNYDLTKYLLDKGADAKFGEFIETAVLVGDVRIVNLLLERGADPTKGMLVAVQSGREQILQLLVDNKADVSSPVLITLAAKKGNLGIVSMLLKAGADPENGMSAAVFGGFADILEMLIEKGADAKKPEYILHAVKMGNRPLASQLFLHGAPKKVIDETGQPLIIIAALRWDTLLVQLLLKNGVDPNAKNRAGDTALHIVANDEASKGYPKFEKMKNARLPMVQALVDGGADVNATNAKGETVRKSLGGGDGDVKKILDAAGAVNKIGTN
ncbi:MAG: ankyrin repeat domain-containing protein [Pyrinomonadaceae bacterium]|nr:ankyrin repeat domain-containing protein [Pyrinomonadaceae bacterium]